MNKKKEDKVDRIVKMLWERLHYAEIKENGHIRVSGLDFWCTSEKWFDPIKKVKGVGLRKFIEYLEGER